MVMWVVKLQVILFVPCRIFSKYSKIYIDCFNKMSIIKGNLILDIPIIMVDFLKLCYAEK